MMFLKRNLTQKEALNKHLNGEREYTYFVSAEKVKKNNQREPRRCEKSISISCYVS